MSRADLSAPVQRLRSLMPLLPRLRIPIRGDQSCFPLRRILIDEFCCGMLREFTHWITQLVTKIALNSDFDQERLEHLVSAACSAIASPSSPFLPKSSILTETQTHRHDGTREESTSVNGGQCTYIIFMIAGTDLLTSTM